MKQKFCIVVETDDITEIDRIAKAEERPRSFIIRKAIKDFLKSKKEVVKKGENGVKKRF